ncbi:MAG: hypothetical protein Q7S40_06730 [Opitutaceae bacterium]|nr:hypothetical protein [Opitutaceae bacterium]
MKNLTRLLVVAASFGVGLALSAQTPPAGGSGGSGGRRGHGGPGGPDGHGRGPGPIIRVLDVDQDHVISVGELANAPAAIRALDTNGDGSVSVGELRPARPANAPTPPSGAPARPEGARPRPLDPIMLALDVSRDGALSGSEITEAAAHLLALDGNGDGALTFDEFRPLPPTN